MDPAPDDRPEPLRRFDRDLAAFESSRQKSVSSGWGGAADAYRLLGQILGGVFGGVGLGWLADHFLHTTPWGLVVGIVFGAGTAMVAAIRTASRASAKAAGPEKSLGSAPPVPEDDED